MDDWEEIESYYAVLDQHGPRYGFHPEPSKSVLVVPEGSEEAAEAKFASRRFDIVSGARYLEGFVG